MSSAIAIPHHTLSESTSPSSSTTTASPSNTPNTSTGTTRSITIHAWHITASTTSISNASECDALQSSLGFPLPEMTFGNNYLELEHQTSGWKMRFDTRGALGGVRGGEMEEGDGGVKVGYADAWLKSRTDPGTSMPLPATVAAKPYDWTYTTTYSGHHPDPDPNPDPATDADPNSEPPPAVSEIHKWTDADPTDQSHTIPLSELTKPDPILFYAEVPLFEDELHDNGSSTLIVRIRVMPTCIFILARFTLRVDNVLFRIHDTRLFHSFTSPSPLVVRQVSGWEAPYDRVKRQLPKRNDLTPLTDSNFIAKVLTEMPSEASQKTGAGTRWRGLRTKVDIAKLEPRS